jgi:hypothetical protein
MHHGFEIWSMVIVAYTLQALKIWRSRSWFLNLNLWCAICKTKMKVFIFQCFCSLETFHDHWRSMLVVGIVFWYVHCKVTKYSTIWASAMSSLSYVQSCKSQFLEVQMYVCWTSCVINVFCFLFFQVAICNS